MTRLDELIIAQLTAAIPAREDKVTATGVVFTDPHGALLQHLLQRCDQVIVGARTYQQAETAAATATALESRHRVTIAGFDASLRLDQLLSHADTPLIAATHLPKSLAELNYYAQALAARRAGAPVTLVAGGNNKHMTRNQNTILTQAFARVRASRGQGKFRCLQAETPQEIADYQPVRGELWAVGGVFSGTNADHGGNLLATHAVRDLLSVGELPGPIIDLGCGNGSVARAINAALPDARIIATDTAADAIESARLNVPQVELVWDHSAQSLPDAEASAVLLNPPFHAGTTVDPTMVQGLLAAAHRLLRPSGVLYLVHNSHLRYRALLAESFRDVTQLGRDRRFTVLRAQV
ncbi:class I SAM-dependent methyltransferase [Boudabousia marimammalium]|uniref:Uncharacterized protein n=1 Tax=Boudabousia marimammalium TaxID=156892 RepID=A0A1Q5PKF4_9ACTO|nr:methyltransferase [Boudabousia marimammalium]OKL46698.1 hypothetical protein BM477_07015 [Boudabousia marimammalium]